MKKQKKQIFKIKIDSKEITHIVKNQTIEGKINKKPFVVYRYSSADNNIGCYDNDYELADKDKFTEEEQDEIREYVDMKVEWK